MLNFKDVYQCLDEHKVYVGGLIVAVCGYVAFWRYMQGGMCRSKARMDGKTVLITGANTGIGLETAKDLAKRGARVLLACRSRERGEAALRTIKEYSGNNNVVLYMLDLACLQSVRECAAEVLAKESRLDVLINNAGLMWFPQWKTKDGFDIQFGTNHLGHFLLTNLLMDLIKKSAPARIINVSSFGHTLLKGTIRFDDINLEKNFSRFDAYFQSKLANVLFSLELSKRLTGTGVTANSLHPGSVRTELKRFKDEYILPVRLLLTVIYYLACPFIKTARSGAQTSIYLAVDPDLADVTGKYFSDCAIVEPSKAAQDEAVASRLWKVSEEMVGLNK